MKINNENASIAIHAIMDAYVMLPYNGFRLCIEDKAPEGISKQTAGKMTETHTIAEEDLPQFVKEALGLAAKSVSSMLDESLEPDFFGVTVPVESFPDGYDDKYDHMVIFYEALLKKAKDVDDLKKLANTYVRHEWRHGCQFNWLRDHGLSVMEALMAENETLYGSGPLEADAHNYQDGNEVDLDVAMASFIS